MKLVQLKTKLPLEDLEALSRAMREYETKIREKDQLLADLMSKWNDTCDEVMGQDTKKSRARQARRIIDLEAALKEATAQKPVWDRLDHLANQLVDLHDTLTANEKRPGEPLSELEYRRMVREGIGGGGLSSYWANRLLSTLEAARADAVEAAGALMVDMEQAPVGSLMAKLLMANSLMRQERDRYRRALQDCAVHAVNRDTCGVCGKHFEDCEDDRASEEEPPYTEENTFPACAGARARAVLLRTTG